MEKRLLVVLFIAGVIGWGRVASAQDDPYAAEEAPAEEEPVEEAPAEPAEPAEEEPVGEAPAEPVGEAPVEPVGEAPVEPVEEALAEPVGEAPVEPVEEGDDEDAPTTPPFRRTFAGSSVYWSNAFTARSLDRDYDLTWAPMYTMGFGFSPVWNITSDLRLLSDIGFDVSLSDGPAAHSVRKNEVFFRDIPISAAYSHTFTINDDVRFRTGLDLSIALPTSQMSRYLTMYTALRIGTQATFIFPTVLEGLSLGWRPTFTKYFYESENPHPDENPLDATPIPDTQKATSTTYQALAYSSSMNPSWRVSNGLNLRLGLVSTLSFAFGYTHHYVYKYAPSEYHLATDGPCTVPEGCAGPRDTGHDERGVYLQMFSYSLGYLLPSPLEMLSLSLGATTSTNQLAPDGQYHTPFFNRETVMNFGIAVDIDALVTAAQGGRKRTRKVWEER